MGIHISKLQNPDLYNSTLEEAKRLLTIIDEIRVSVKKVTAETPRKIEKKIIEVSPANYDGKYFSATALFKEMGITIKELYSRFEKMNWIEKK